MTGYGIATKDCGTNKYTVEIKSLNSKFLELALKLPKAFSEKEIILRNDCSKFIERGKVNISINIEHQESDKKSATVDAELLKNYYNQLKEISSNLGESPENLFQLALNFPEVIKYEEESINEDEWQALYATFQDALAAFQKFRQDEGNTLMKDLTMRIDNIMESLAKVVEMEPRRVPIIRERLLGCLNEYVGKENVDINRLEQELIYYIDKLDITEEKIRLKSHCDYFTKTIHSADANGKKLGFLSQEIGREINTMGSKANDAEIQQTVVKMKEELEKIKEQLLNVL